MCEAESHARLAFALELESSLAHAIDVMSEQFSEPLRAALESGAIAEEDEETVRKALTLAKKGRLNELWDITTSWTLLLAKRTVTAQNEPEKKHG